MYSTLVFMYSTLVFMYSTLVFMYSTLVFMYSTLVFKQKKTLQSMLDKGSSDLTFPLKSSLKSILKSARARKTVDNFLFQRKSQERNG